MQRIVACLLLLLSSHVLAEFPAGIIEVRLAPWVEVNTRSDFSGRESNTDGDGQGIYGELGNGQWFGYLSHFTTEYDDGYDSEVDDRRLGLGWRWGEQAQLELRAERYDYDTEDDATNGHGFHLGGMMPFNARLKGFARLGHVSFDQDDADGPEYVAGLRFQAATNIGLSLRYRGQYLETETGFELERHYGVIGVGYLW